MKGSSAGNATVRAEMENLAAVEMLRTIPGVQGHALKYVMSQVEGIRGLVALSEAELRRILGDEQGRKAYWFMHFDGRVGGGVEMERRYAEGVAGSSGQK